MAPKKKQAKGGTCDAVQGETYHTQPQETFSFDWMDMFCFPYLLCARFWDCCISLCAGTNQCLVYFMLLQWCMCKVAKCSTPDPMVYPYYFYLYCQVFSMTLGVILIWVFFGKSFIIPYFQSFYKAIAEVSDPVPAPPNRNTTRKAARLAFRKYCFRKSEIFDTSLEGPSINLNTNSAVRLVASYSLDLAVVAFDVFILDKLF